MTTKQILTADQLTTDTTTDIDARDTNGRPVEVGMIVRSVDPKGTPGETYRVRKIYVSETGVPALSLDVVGETDSRTSFPAYRSLVVESAPVTEALGYPFGMPGDSGYVAPRVDAAKNAAII